MTEFEAYMKYLLDNITTEWNKLDESDKATLREYAPRLCELLAASAVLVGYLNSADRPTTTDSVDFGPISEYPNLREVDFDKPTHDPATKQF